MNTIEELYNKWLNDEVTCHCWHDGPYTTLRKNVPKYCYVSNIYIDSLEKYKKYVLDILE